MEKDYTIYVKLEFAHNLQAESKQEAIEIVRQIMLEQNDVLIRDHEIVHIDEYSEIEQ